MVNRRIFLGALGSSAAVLAAAPFLKGRGFADALVAIQNPTKAGLSAEALARDEGFWFAAQQAFSVDRSLVNLNNGGVSPAPRIVQQAMKRALDYSHTAPTHAMWKVLEPQKEGVRQRLARLFGVDSEEIAIVRNASEGLQICQFGIDLERGDEVLTSNQDYPRMVSTFQQRERREGIILKQISLPVPCENPDVIVRCFQEGITERTRLILMCHVINITGQILPVREVVSMARDRDIPVIVDGAHSFAHFDFNHRDLECDYFATSLHKWLFAPHGTGLLYVRRNHIRDLWPLMAAPEGIIEDIRKFEEIGTHPAANFVAIGDALTFHEGLTAPRKEARLRYLRDTWARRLLTHDRVRLHTSLDPRFSCGIATVEIKGIDSNELTRHLWQNHRIIVTGIKHAQFEGIRVSPSVYTTLEELDRFSDAMERVIQYGLPG